MDVCIYVTQILINEKYILNQSDYKEIKEKSASFYDRVIHTVL